MSILSRFAVSLAAAALALVVPGQLASAQPLPTDPTLVTGELENGLHYIVRKHSIPPGRAVMWMHMHTGSLNETDAQRGLAHYLEHMAFNGSEHFPPGSVVPFFQSLGMQFGRDQNAYTNMEETTYQLSLPDAKADTLAKGMSFFSDIAGRLSLLPKEIDDERQIILEERRRGLGGRERTGRYITEHMTPGSIYGQRITIGLEETIKAVKQPDFKDYYGKYYCAANATLIVVADTDPAEVVKFITQQFGSLPKKPRPTPQELGVKAYDHNFALVASDPELRGGDVRIVHVEPARPATTTVPMYRAELVRELGQMAFNRRTGEKVAAGGTPFQSASVSISNQPRGIFTAGISGRTTAPDRWQDALNGIALELQRARAFGFTQHEIDDAKKQVFSGAERGVETAATAPADALIRRINGGVTSGEPIMSPQQHLELLKSLLPGITTEEIAKSFADELDPKAVAFIAILPSGDHVPSESQLLEAGLKALQVKPTQETETVRSVAQLMSEPPKGGSVKESDEHAATKVWNGWLTNNVRVHYRFMDERKNEVSIHIGLVGGDLLETAENRGITQAAQLAWSRPATQKLSGTEIREFMTGRKISVRGGGGGGGRGGGRRGGGGGGGGGDSIALSISGSPEELETGFQLAYLLLTEPKIEPTAFEQFQTNMKQALAESLKSPMVVGARAVAAAIYPESEVRTKPLTVEQLDKLSLSSAQAWLEKLIKESPIEVAIVGDLPKDRAIELVSRYLGALPARERVGPANFAALRKLPATKGPRTVEKTVETPTPQAFVYSGFYGADENNLADVRALNMAARILSTRMVKEVREEAQLVYSISAASSPASTFPGFGTFSASAPTAPEHAAALVEKLASMYAAFAKDGPSEEEMETARKQMANTYDEQMRNPAYWFGRLQQLTFRGASLDDIVAAPAAYQSITAEQVHATFARYYKPGRTITVVVRPSGGGAAGAAGASPPGEGR